MVIVAEVTKRYRVTEIRIAEVRVTVVRVAEVRATHEG